MSDGEIRTAYVRDYGILAKNDKGQQLYVDALGKQTTDQFSNGERNQILWETNFLDPAAKALYVDSSGVKTDNPNPVIAFDRGGPEINVYRNPNSNVSFNNISLQYSADGDTWYDAGQVSSRRISQSVTNNDDSIDLADIGTYDFFRSGFAARFIRVVGDTGASDFRLDGIGVFPESAGKVQLIADKVFLDNVQSYVNSDGTTITTENASGETVNRGPSVAGVGDGLYAPVTPGDRVTYGASGVAIPSVVEVSRSEVIPFTRTVDVRITDPTTTGVDRLIVDGSANVSNLIGALDRYEIGVEKINLGGTINTYAGRVETVLANGSVVLDDGVAENYVAKTYFGGETVYRLINPAQQGLVGEEVINALRDPLDNFRLEALEYNGNEQVFDLFDGAVLFDPFSAELGRKAGDPIQHFQGNPVLHSVGEIQRYLGGEVARDENGKIVRNGDDSVFKRLPGQAVISDRRDLIYAPDFVDFSFTSNGQILDLSDESALNLQVNQGIDAWGLDFESRGITNNEFGGADRLISVVVSSERGIFALDPSDYSFDEASGLLTITGVDSNKVSGDVSIRTHLALTAFHREGDTVRYFGDEAVQNGQPVVQKVGSEFVISTTADGAQILYTSDAGLALQDGFAPITETNGDAITQLRGAPIFDFIGGQWTERTITRAQQNNLTVQRYLGNEALIYFGGEQAYNSASDAILEEQVVTRISGLGIPGDIFYTNGIFPDASGNRVVDQNDVFEINLGDGDDTFTLNFTPSSPFELNTGAGNDRVAVRATEGQTTLNLGEGDDLVAVGSQAGLWETSTLSGRRPSFEPTPNDSEFINYLGNLNDINGSVLVNGGSGVDRVTIDETRETVGNSGELTDTLLRGFGIAAGHGVVYNNDDSVEFVEVALGSGDDILRVSGTDDALFTRIEGRSGNDTFNIEGTSSATNIYGDSESGQVNVGFRTFDVAPGDDLFRVGSLSSDAVNREQSVLGTIDGRLRLFGGGTNDSVDASGNPTVVNSNNQDGDEIIFYNGGGGAGNGVLEATELLGYGMDAGVAYAEVQAITLRLADARDVLFIAGTHTGQTDVIGGNESGAGDEINIGAISGPTTIRGGGGDDIIRVNYDQNGVQTFASGVASSLLLKGENGSDIYEIGLAGLATATVDIDDDAGAADTGNDRVRIFGNDDDNIFLFRANQLSDRGVVASYQVDENLLPVAGGFVERVNYNSEIELIDVSGRDGDDTFVFDDTLSGMTVRGDEGDDTFQLGQVFESARNGLNPSNGLDPLDYFETVQTTRGFLSNGVSQTAVLLGGEGNDNFTIYRNKAEIFARGEEGDDTFLVRSFVRVDPNDPKAPFTNINGGQGADLISFTVNAPVRIEGGDGFDTLTVVGTEFGDDFVVNEFGVFGGGLFITYSGIEKLKVDALEGNDRFFISGTAEDVEVEIVGGLGSDTFNVGGSNGEPVIVVSNSLEGNSGLIDQSIFAAADDYRNVFLRDLSVKVADNDEAGILIVQDRGPLTLLEGVDSNSGVIDDYLVSSYTVVLTRAPEETVRVAATQIDANAKLRRAGAEGIHLSTEPTDGFSVNGATLFFNRDNWFIPQTVYVKAPQDSVAEGRQNFQIQHKVTQGARSQDGGAYDNLASLSVNVEVFDDEVADVILIPMTAGSNTGNLNADTRTLVFENGELTDTFGIILSRMPEAGADVTLTLGGFGIGVGQQATLSASTLTFTSANYQTPQVVTITGVQDTDKEARHFARVEATLGNARENFISLSPDDLAQDLRDTIVGAGGIYSASVAGNVVTITGPAFTLDLEVMNSGGVGVTPGINIATSDATLAGGAREVEISFATDFQAGDVFSITVDGATLSYTVRTDSDGSAETIGEVVAGIVNLINDSSATDLGDVDAKNLGSSLELESLNTFLSGGTLTRFATTTELGSDDDVTSFTATIPASFALGDAFSIQVGRSILTHIVTTGSGAATQTRAEVIAELVTLITDAESNDFKDLVVSSNATSVTVMSGSEFDAWARQKTGASTIADGVTVQAFKTFEVTFSGTIKDGDTFRLEIKPESGRAEQTINYIAGMNGEPEFFDRLDVELADDDSAQVIIDQGNGGVTVSEPSQELFLGSGFVGTLVDIPHFEQGTPHNNNATAQLIPHNFFSSADVPVGTGTLARAKIIGTGDNLADVYKIEVTAANVGQDVFLRLSNRPGSGAVTPFNGSVSIVQDVLVNNSNAAVLGNSSTFRFASTGTYYITVTSNASAVVNQGESYTLNLWVPGVEASFGFTGDFGVSELAETEAAHNDIENAQNLDFGKWNTNSNPNIELSSGAGALPHITVRGTGDGLNDFYKFEVTQDMIDNASGNAVDGIFDLDNSFDFGDQIFWASRLVIYSPTGDIHAAGPGFSSPEQGEGPVDDSFFNDYVRTEFTQPGVYTIEVSNALSSEGLPSGVTYDLNVSVEEHLVDSFIFVPEPVLENDSGNNGIVIDQNGNVTSTNLDNIDRINFKADGSLDDSNFFTFDDLAVGNGFFGGDIDSSTPYARILGSGDGTYDVFGFKVTDDLLNPIAISGNIGDGSTSATGPFFSELTLRLNGDVEVGDVWTLGLRHRDYSYTVTNTGPNAVTDMAGVASQLLNQLPARFSTSEVDTVSSPGQVLLKIRDNSGFNLVGASGEPGGLVQVVQNSGSVTTSTTLTQSDGTTPAQLDFAELTFNGTAQAGEQITIDLDNDSVADATYTVGTSASTGVIVTSLASQLNSLTGITSTNTGGKLRVTGTSSFTLAYRSAADLSGLTISADVIAVSGNVDAVPFTQLVVEFTAPVREGETWGITINGTKTTFTVGSTETAQAVASGLAGKATLAAFTPVAAAGKLTLNAPGTSSLSFGGVTVSPSGSGSQAATTATSDFVTVPTVSAGETWIVRVIADGTGNEIARAEASTTGADTSPSIATALATSLTSGMTYARPEGATLTVLRTDAMAFSLVFSKVLVNDDATEPRAETYTFAGTTGAAGESYTLQLAGGGTVISTFTSAASGESIRDGLGDAATTAGFRLFKASTANQLVVVRLDGTDFDLELVKGFDVSLVNPAVTEQAVRVLDPPNAAPPAAGWAVDVQLVQGTAPWVSSAASTAATLEGRLDALAAATVATGFTAFRVGSGNASQLYVVRDTNVAFDARIHNGTTDVVVAPNAGTPRAETYTVSGTSGASGNVYTLTEKGSGTVISTFTAGAGGESIRNGLADAAGILAGYQLFKGSANELIVVRDSGVDFEVVLSSTIAQTAAIAEQAVRVVDPPNAIGTGDWQLERRNTAGSGNYGVVETSTSGSVQARVDDFVGASNANFKLYRDGSGATSELFIIRNNANSFDTRISVLQTATSTDATVVKLALTGTVNSNVTWTATVDGNDLTYVVSNPADTIDTVATGLASNINGLATYNSVAVGSDIFIVKQATGDIITSSAVTAFTVAPASIASHVGTIDVNYTQTITLESADGVSDIYTGDKWRVNLPGLADLKLEDGLLKDGAAPIAGSFGNLGALATSLANALNAEAGITSSASGAVITVSHSSGDVIDVDMIKQTRNRLATNGDRAQSSSPLDANLFYESNQVTLSGSWTSGTLWTVTIDGNNYSYTTDAADGPKTLSTIAFELEKVINAGLAALPGPQELVASFSGPNISIDRLSTAPASVPANVPFSLDVARGTGTVRVLVDVDGANRVNGSTSFTRTGFDFFRGFFTISDFVNFTATPTLDLYQKIGPNSVNLVGSTASHSGRDVGSDFDDDPFKEYELSAEGEYYIVIGSQIDYDDFSVIYDEASPFADRRQGVAVGQNYNAVVSITDQPTNQNAITLDGKRLEFTDGQGVGQSGNIISYDPLERLFIVDPDNRGIDPWVQDPDNTSRFDIFELPSDDYFNNIIRDEYTIRLSKSPDAPVIIDLLPERTRTYDADEAFNPVVFYGEQNEVQVRLATQQAQIRVTDTDVSAMTLTLTIGNTEYTVTGNSLADLKSAIEGSPSGNVEKRITNISGAPTGPHSGAIAGLTAVISGNDLTLTHATERFYTELETASRIDNYTGNQIDVELEGVIEAGQDWMLQLGGNTLNFKIVSSTTDRDSLGKWIQTGSDFTWTALANSGARLTTITTAIESLIESAPELVDYGVTRNGRILNISQTADFTSNVSVTNNGVASNSGGISIQPIHAQVIQQVVLNGTNYLSGVTVEVEAINDDFIDGGDALVFAAFEERINSIRGPLTINGGFGESDERFLNNPILYPGEINEPLADGLSQIVGSAVIPELVTPFDNGQRAYIEDLFATHINPNTGLRPGFDPRMNDFLYTVEFLDGRAKGGVYRVLNDFGVSKDIFSIGNRNGIAVNWGTDQATIDSYFDTRLSLLTSAFTANATDGSGVTTSTFSTTARWNQSMLTFTGNAANTEEWTVNLEGIAPISAQVDRSDNTAGAINTLGRAVFNLRDQINADGTYEAEVRVGLLGEVNLLVNRADGNDFTISTSRERTNDTSSVAEAVTLSGFIGSSFPALDGNVITTYALFAKRDQDFSMLSGDALSLTVAYTDDSGSSQNLNQSFNLSTSATMETVLNDFVNVFAGNAAESALSPSIAGRRVTFESDWLVNEETGTLVKPLVGNAYYYAPLNANFDVEEPDQVDVLNVFNGNSPSNDSGTLTGDRLIGFGMGDDTVIGGRLLPGGITYKSLEELNIELGTGNDSLVIENTHAGKTTINTGAGDDRIAIANTSGTLNVEGDAGDDTLHIATADLNGNVADSEGHLETIMGHLLFDGGAGTDRLTVDDSSDSSSEVGTLTEDAFEGFGFGSVTEVQTLTVVGQSGFYRISRGDVNVPWYYIRPGVARPGALGVVLDVRFTAAQVQDHLEYIYGLGNVAVTLISSGDGAKTYGIEFIGQLAGADVAPIRWADPGPINLVANGDLGAVNAGGISLPNANSNRAEVVVGVRTSAEEDPSGGNTQQFLEILNADRGTFHDHSP